MNFRLTCGAALGLAAALTVTGCGAAKGTVSGKVTHKGKSVVWGSVTLIASDNVQYAEQIKPDGTYTIPNVPGGPCKLTVSSPNPDGTTRGGPAAAGGDLGGGGDTGAPPPPPKGAWFPIPEKYGDVAQSGLTGKVNGNTVIDLDLP